MRFPRERHRQILHLKSLEFSLLKVPPTKSAKARGVVLGSPKLELARPRAWQANREAADRYAANVLPIIREIQSSGVKSLRAVARALTARGIETRRGGAWSPVQVGNLLRRAVSG